MEGEKKPSSSWIADELLDFRKSAGTPADSSFSSSSSSASSPGYFSSVFPPGSTEMSKDSAESDLFWTSSERRTDDLIGNAQAAAADGKSQGSPSRRQTTWSKDGKQVDPNQSDESTYLCSSVHYGGRDFYVSIPSNQVCGAPKSDKKADEGDDSGDANIANRGEWWQVRVLDVDGEWRGEIANLCWPVFRELLLSRCASYLQESAFQHLKSHFPYLSRGLRFACIKILLSMYEVWAAEKLFRVVTSSFYRSEAVDTLVVISSRGDAGFAADAAAQIKRREALDRQEASDHSIKHLMGYARLSASSVLWRWEWIIAYAVTLDFRLCPSFSARRHVLTIKEK
ncbi:hypothetical protein MUK42_17182 [Musa troglodytarum]|uniref:Uncharacterized protein n=1 Tax=Musa troglodytarum TaxID=320322 RepID=A0A9E7HX03_9LILI|nr:hypothetical protein MUK42_17182 [Musa troglodytarum]